MKMSSSAQEAVVAGVSLILCGVFGLVANYCFQTGGDPTYDFVYDLAGYGSALLACGCLYMFVTSGFKMSSGEK